MKIAALEVHFGLSHHVNKVPRHYHHALTSLPLEPSTRRTVTIRWCNSSPLWLKCVVYFIPENRAKTQLLSGLRPVRVSPRSLKRIREIKQRKWQFIGWLEHAIIPAQMRPPRLRPRRSHLPSSRLKLELELPSLASKPSCFFWFERHVIILEGATL